MLGALLHSSVHPVWVQLGGLVAFLLIIPFARHVDPDFWWHLRTGELIVTSGLPSTDPFSWTVEGTAWVMHEWLSEALLYAVYTVFGYVGSVLMFGFAATGALGLMYGLGRRAGAGTRVLVAVILLSTLLLGFVLTTRPVVFTWLLFATFVYLLQRNDEGDRIPVWVLPVLMALWANLHLGFVYGLMTVSIWVIARMYERVRGRDVDLKTPFLVLAACALAPLLNPSGPALYSHIVSYTFEGELERSVINEWQSPYFGTLIMFPLLAATALMIGAILTRKVGAFLVLLSLAVIVLSTQAVRNVPFVALLLAPVVATALAQQWRFARSESDSPTRMPALIAAAIVASVGALTFAGVIQLNGPPGRVPSDQGYPQEGAAYIREHLAGSRLLNGYGWGGYLIEELYPDAKVFIDGRADMYGPELLRDYLTMTRTSPGWEALLDDYEIEAVLMAPVVPLSLSLAESPEWKLVFEGEVEQIYVRK